MTNMWHWLTITLLLVLPTAGWSQTAENGAAPAAPHETEAGDVLRFVPLVGVYVMKGCGVESASTWKRLLVNTATSVAVSSAVTYSMKYSIHSERPDHSDDHGFPSGHTMFAFAGATMLSKEYGHVSPWLSVAGYATATAVAIDRVRCDRHNWLQVSAGAAIGVLGTELGYWLGDRLTGEHSQLSLSATPSGISLCYEF